MSFDENVDTMHLVVLFEEEVSLSEVDDVKRVDYS